MMLTQAPSSFSAYECHQRQDIYDKCVIEAFDFSSLSLPLPATLDYQRSKKQSSRYLSFEMRHSQETKLPIYKIGYRSDILEYIIFTEGSSFKGIYHSLYLSFINQRICNFFHDQWPRPRQCTNTSKHLQPKKANIGNQLKLGQGYFQQLAVRRKLHLHKTK